MLLLLIVLRPSLRVREHFIGRVDPDHFLVGRFFFGARVLVRMPDERELNISLLHLLLAAVVAQPEDFVMIL